MNQLMRISNGMKIFVYAVITIVAIAVLGAFFVIGSPQEARLEKFDDLRVQNLQATQWSIIEYWQRKGELPEELALLNNDISGFRVPVDPVTGNEYTYEVRGKNMFTLCAEFARPSNESLESQPYTMGAVEENWKHAAGKHCFERTIDEDYYKPMGEGGIMPIPVKPF